MTPTDFVADVPDAPASNHPALLGQLAADLLALNYTVDGVAELVGDEAWQALEKDQLIPALLACQQAGTSGDQPAAPVLLWMLGERISDDQLGTAFPRTGPEGLHRLGLAERSDADHWHATVDLRPYTSDTSGDLWVASDLGQHQRPGVLRRDHVLGIGHASLNLAQLTIRPAVDRALDLGTGCGIQTFHLLDHARHVTATDISTRALAFTRFNLLLNAEGLRLDPADLGARVTLRQGSLLDPVAGETFDLIVSNPPFVITPRQPGESAANQFTYRDGGLPGDDIVSTLVRDLPALLTEGGTAQLLGNWEITAGSGTWHERIESWIPAGVDGWVIQREQLTPSGYALTWLRDAAETRDPHWFAERYSAYLADFASRNVEAIGFGSVVLRTQPPGGLSQAGPAPLRRFEEITHPLEQPIGPHIAAALRRQDWSTAHTGDLADQHLEVSDDVTEERHQRPGAEHPGVILLRQGAGFRRTNLLSTELAGFVSACDGELTAGQITMALGALLGQDDEGFREALLADVLELLLDGFLIPADDHWDQDRPVEVGH
ncbi:class I SAM-dependent methyltransferase [Arthrobacter sp. 260]|uniref:class I SAM-dependent methyltransferase n=1 Tax=Arthrobacter sp. 260 TaxID=2735314 RepID=UPI003209C8AE